jgi:hypothetical protein
MMLAAHDAQGRFHWYILWYTKECATPELECAIAAAENFLALAGDQA